MLHALQLGLLLLLKTLLDPLAQVLRELLIALLADGLRVPCRELTLLEQLLTCIAEEVLLVVSLVEELLTASSDRLLAEGAVVTEELDVMRLAVRKPSFS